MHRRPARALLRRTLAVLSAGAVASVALAATSTLERPSTAVADGDAARLSAARAGNVVTPGDFTGYGFDQCVAPTQKMMNTWLQSSPFLAVGIYISGDSRACRSQPNLSPTWVRKQLARGWRLLPITLGPQASCQPRFPRYDDDRTINPKPGAKKRYGKARKQGSAEAVDAVAAASALGIVAGSTLWYDLEGFDLGNTHCRESALAFLSAWTNKIRKLDYVSGVYSSAGSGIKMLDDARHSKRSGVTLPDMIWVARWDGRANVETSYLRSDGWRGARVKQYQGGHNETWGGVTINIDRNFLDVGRGSVAEPESHCGGVKIAYGLYPPLVPGTGKDAAPGPKVKALQCLLQERGLYTGKINGTYSPRTQVAAGAFQEQRGFPVSTKWNRRDWVSLLAAGNRPVLKFGSAGPEVRRVQRALNAMFDRDKPLKANGVYNATTMAAVRAWQKKIRIEQSGVVGRVGWKALAEGKRRR
ncbi:MAG: glycoside hydrolase domain-containing protein [Nocardioides sp.]